jgi:DNA polymerase
VTQRVLHIDLETRSTVELRDANVYIYAEHPNTDIWCAAWAFENDEPELWWPGDPCPAEIRSHVEGGGIIAAFNANFERILWREILGPRYRWPVPNLRQYRCVMVKCLAMSMPGKLEHAAPALGLTITKDAAGSRVMMQMAKPRRPRKGEAPGLYWWNDPDKIRRLGEYCQQDVRTEQGVDSRTIPLSKDEQELWFLDCDINDRGVFIDDKLCLAAKTLVASVEKRLDAELEKLTDFAVNGVSNTGQMTAWLRARGLDVPGVAKDVIEGLLIRDDLDPVVRRVVEIRQEGGKTSVAKIDAMLARRQRDGRMRGNLQFHGAGTGRWAGRGAQLQNLPRPSNDDDKQPMIDTILESKDDRLIEALYGNTLTVIADCIRGMIKAPPGKDLIAADFASIESRVNAWLAGEARKIRAFEDYDVGEGANVYFIAASDVYNVPAKSIVKGTVQYQVGKVTELSMGYQGGPGAFAKMAKNYSLDIAAAYPSVRQTASGENIEKAAKGWEDRGRKSGMSETRWLTAELIKLAWRDRNPAIVQYWRHLESAAIEAVQNPGKQCVAGVTGKIDYKRVGSFLFCRLPSKRVLTYPYPSVVRTKTPWTDSNGDAVFKDALRYKGVNSVTRQWTEQAFYGGLADENVVQAVSRDVMVVGMKAATAAGYPCVLTVHDEDVGEVDHGFGSLDEFSALMVTKDPWMAGLPLAAEAWRGERYRK